MSFKNDPRVRLRQLVFPITRNGPPEVAEFREMAQVATRLGGVSGLDEWIDARRQLELIEDPAVERLANEIQRVINRLFDAQLEAVMDRRQSAAPKPISWEERQQLINERESEARQNHRPVGYRTTLRNPPPKPQRRRSLAERMAEGFEKNVRRDVP